MIKIIRDKSDNRDFQELILLLDNELDLRYGNIQEQYNAFNKVDSIDTVVIGYIDNNPVGCGCFKVFNNNTIEIKRMIVKPESRGSGIAKLILTELEKWAIEKGFSKSVLETGIKQPDAIRFYIKLGYTRIDNYGQYKDNQNSICMSKEL
ncbi:MAG: GNAT family N-acetyltransferase [Ignavibacteria bacterium]|nr:GNAT family N-acetyltransferase [Ignavibacteria bacterium]